MKDLQETTGEVDTTGDQETSVAGARGRHVDETPQDDEVQGCGSIGVVVVWCVIFYGLALGKIGSEEQINSVRDTTVYFYCIVPTMFSSSPYMVVYLYNV